MMTTNHTPTPWHEGRYGVCADTTGYGRTHAQVALCENPADSAHIVRCVNAHDELIAALEEAADVLEGCAQRLGNPPGILDLCIGSARAAIARAKGES